MKSHTDPFPSSIDSTIALNERDLDLTINSFENCEHLLSGALQANSSHFIGSVKEGCLEFEIPQTGTRRIHKGQWFLLSKSNLIHKTKVIEQVDGVLISIRFHNLPQITDPSQFFHSKLECLTCPNRNSAFFQSGKSSGRIAEITKQISEVSNHLPFPAYFLKLSLAYELIARVFQQPELSRPAPCRPLISTNDLQSIQMVAKYLEDNLDEDHSLNNLCKQCYINEFKLKKGFKEHYGMTVFGYLRQKRMEKAKSLISNENYSVIEAASEVGYSNASHFARAFKTVHSYNPSELLKTMV